MKNYQQLADQILDLCWEFAQTDPAKAVTKAKEMAVAKDLNNKRGAQYTPSGNCNQPGVDLFSPGRPPVQSKTCQGSSYRSGGCVTIQKIVDKAIKVDPDAELSFARLEGSKVVEHVIGPAKLLDGYTTSEGNPAYSINFEMLDLMGFKNVE